MISEVRPAPHGTRGTGGSPRIVTQLATVPGSPEHRRCSAGSIMTASPPCQLLLYSLASLARSTAPARPALSGRCRQAVPVAFRSPTQSGVLFAKLDGLTGESAGGDEDTACGAAADDHPQQFSHRANRPPCRLATVCTAQQSHPDGLTRCHAAIARRSPDSLRLVTLATLPELLQQLVGNPPRRNFLGCGFPFFSTRPIVRWKRLL